MYGSYESLDKKLIFPQPFPIIKINASKLGTINVCDAPYAQDNL